MLDDILDFFVPPHVRTQVRDHMVDKLIQVSTNEQWRKLIGSYRSDAAFHSAFDQSLNRAIQRFTHEYHDQVIVDALVHNTRFWDYPAVQNALKEIVTSPSSFLVAEQDTVYTSFAHVLPHLDPKRVEQAVHFFLHCLAEEVINIPQLAPIYQVQLQKASLDQARQMVETLRDLRTDQRQWMEALIVSLPPMIAAASPKSLNSGAETQFLLTSPIPGQQTSIIPVHDASGPTAVRILHNLPPLYSEVFGREKDLARVLEGLASRAPLISIEGLAGIGKTTLALETAHHYISNANGSQPSVQPFDAVVWVSAMDRPEQKRWISEVLDTVARILGYRYVSQQPLEQKLIEVDYLLRNHRTLVIVDNFETIEDKDLENWLQRVPEPSKAMITTRRSYPMRTWNVHLQGLEEAEGLDLIKYHAHSLGLQSIATAEDELLQPLLHVTKGSPKIIEMALGYIKRGRLSLDEVVGHLHTASKTVESIFDYLFTRAWEVMSRDAQQVLLVGPFFADLASKEALGAAAGLADYQLDTALEQLVELALLDIDEDWTTTGQRYSMHPLTRAFASLKLQQDQAFEEQARIRWSQYYLALTKRSIITNSSIEIYWNVLTGMVYSELDLEWLNLRNVLKWADVEEQYATLLEFLLCLAHYMNRRLLYFERIYYSQRAAEAAQTLRRRRDEAWLRIDALGWVYIEEGKFSDARWEIMRGLGIAEELQAERQDATDLIALGNAFLARALLEQGDLEEASDTIDNALLLTCSPLIKCRINMVAGDVALARKDYAEAIRFYEPATRITQEHGDADFNATLRYRLGSAYLVNGDLAHAEIEFKKVPDIEKQGVNILVMYAKYGLARVAKEKGDKETASRLAADILKELTRFTPAHQLITQIQTFLKSLEIG